MFMRRISDYETFFCSVSSSRSAPTSSGPSPRARTRTLTPRRTSPPWRPPGLTSRLVSAPRPGPSNSAARVFCIVNLNVKSNANFFFSIFFFPLSFNLAARLRVFPALPGEPGLPAQHCKAIHRSEVCPAGSSQPQNTQTNHQKGGNFETLIK